MDVIFKGMKGLLSELQFWESSIPSGSTYLVGDSLTIADLALFAILSFLNRLGFEPHLSSSFPKLANFVKVVSELDFAV